MKSKDWPAWNVVSKPLSWFKPFEKNTVDHPPIQIAALRKAMHEWGWTFPILARGDGEVIAGHGRLLAGEEELAEGNEQFEEAPVIIAKGWTDAQIRAYRIADNKLSEMRSWLDVNLKSEFSDLQGLGFDLTLTGFGEADFTDLGLAGYEAEPTVPKVKLSDQFGIPPFSVLNAREGWWQDRKRAWIALGIQSELGRGAEAGSKLTMSDTVQKLKPSADQALKRSKKANAVPGGSPKPAANYSKNKARGDGRGRAINAKG